MPMITLAVAVNVSVAIVGAVNVVNTPVLGVVAPMLMLLIVPSVPGANMIAPVELSVIGVELITVKLLRVPTLVKLLLTIVNPKVVLFSNDTPPNNRALVSIDVLVIDPLSATENPGLVNPACDSNGL